MIFPIIFVITEHGIDLLAKHQVSARRYQLFHKYPVDQLIKSAEVVLVQVRQDQKIDLSDSPGLQELQQRPASQKADAASVQYHGLSPFLCVQQQYGTIRTAHI